MVDMQQFRAAFGGRRFGLTRDQPDKGGPKHERQHTRHRERRTPANMLDQEAGQQRGKGNAEVASEAVDPDHSAGLFGMLQQHRDADGVVNRGERAHQRQCNADL